MEKDDICDRDLILRKEFTIEWRRMEKYTTRLLLGTTQNNHEREQGFESRWYMPVGNMELRILGLPWKMSFWFPKRTFSRY